MVTERPPYFTEKAFGALRLWLDDDALFEYEAHALDYEAICARAAEAHSAQLAAVGQFPILLHGRRGCWQFGHAKKLKEDGVNLGDGAMGFSFFGNMDYEGYGAQDDALFIVNLRESLLRRGLESLHDMLSEPLRMRGNRGLPPPGTAAAAAANITETISSRLAAMPDESAAVAELSSASAPAAPAAAAEPVTLEVFDAESERGSVVTLGGDSTVGCLREALLQLSLPCCARARSKGNALTVLHDGRILTASARTLKDEGVISLPVVVVTASGLSATTNHTACTGCGGAMDNSACKGSCATTLLPVGTVHSFGASRALVGRAQRGEGPTGSQDEEGEGAAASATDEDALCRICYGAANENGLGRLVSPCLCTGSVCLLFACRLPVVSPRLPALTALMAVVATAVCHR